MSKKIWQTLILLIFFVILNLYHHFGYIGHYGYDDMEYAKIAHNLNNGIIDYNNHFTFRFPIIAFTALSYKIFGVSDFASSLPSIIITFLILITIYYTLKNRSILTLVVALSFTVFSNWFIFYSDKLMPDIYVAFGIMFALFILHKFKFNSSKKHPFCYSFLFALVLLFGFTAKETIILIIPLLLYFFIYDLFKRNDLKFWLYAFISGTILLLIYFVVIWLLTGSIVKRFEAISQNSYLNLCSYDKQSFRILAERLGYKFFTLMIGQGMLTGYVFVLAFLLFNKFKGVFQVKDTFSFYLVSSIILLLSSNFMTISLTSYVPLCLDVRHYLFIIPVVAIPTSIILTDIEKYKNNTFYILILISVLLFTIISIVINSEMFWQLFCPLFVLTSFIFAFRNKPNYVKIITLAIIILLIGVPLKMINYAKNVNYWQQKKIVTEQIIKKYSNCYIVTDDVQIRLGEYYNKFNAENNITFLNFNSYVVDTVSNKKSILLLNNYTQYLSGLDNYNLPFYVKNIDTANSLLYENKQLNIKIYELNKVIDLTKLPIIIKSENTFENSVLNWDINQPSIVLENKYNGKSSNFVNEYSATFKYSFDSILTKPYYAIVLSSNLQIYFESETKSKLVISLENNEGGYYWQGYELNKYIKSYSNWWPVKLDIVINKNEIKLPSLLKVYVWNVDKKKCYVDDFKVEILGIK